MFFIIRKIRVINIKKDYRNEKKKEKILIMFLFYLFIFLLSSIYIRRKYWIRENFRLPVFDGFTCFEMS